MTDMYIRRGVGMGLRLRIALLVCVVSAIGAGAFFGFRALRRSPGEEPGPTSMEEETAGRPVPASAGSDASEVRPEPVAIKRPPPPAKPANPDVPDTGISLIATAEQLAAQGEWDAAREKAWETIEVSTHQPALDRAYALLGEIHTALLTSPRSMPEKVEYTVQAGDSLAKLAKDFGTTIELIQRSNNVTGSMIRIGDRLRIFQGMFHVEIDKSDNILDLYLNGRFFKRYRVGTGEYNRTPVGDFVITDRIFQPTWWRPDGRAIPYGDPENELGTHWLSLNIRGYGLHGTWQPETIGRQASAGCIRLTNDNIEELYTFLPIGTSVTIVD